MQEEITRPGKLLNPDGSLTQVGLDAPAPPRCEPGGCPFLPG